MTVEILFNTDITLALSHFHVWPLAAAHCVACVSRTMGYYLCMLASIHGVVGVIREAGQG